MVVGPRPWSVSGPKASGKRGDMVTAAARAQQPRPRLRGALHALVALIAPFITLALVLIADSPREWVGAAVFGASLIALYSTSASLHFRGPLVGRPFVRRLDHAAIFLLIAGTYVPLCLALPNRRAGLILMIVAASVAGLGVMVKLLSPRPIRRVSVPLYVATGWLGVALFPQVVAWLPPVYVALLLVGGLLYSAGAVIYALRRPDSFPGVWGFHENFHLLVTGGTAAHITLVILVLQAG